MTEKTPEVSDRQGGAVDCVTCSDAAPAAEVLRTSVDRAVVRFDSACAPGDGEVEVGIALVEAQPGDWVLVHAGEAIAVLPRPLEE